MLEQQQGVRLPGDRAQNLYAFVHGHTSGATRQIAKAVDMFLRPAWVEVISDEGQHHDSGRDRPEAIAGMGDDHVKGMTLYSEIENSSTRKAFLEILLDPCRPGHAVPNGLPEGEGVSKNGDQRPRPEL
jgi:hypothetical protein